MAVTIRISFFLILFSAACFFFHPFHKPRIIFRNGLIISDSSQCRLRQHGLYLTVAHIVCMRICIYAATRSPAKWSYAIVTRYLSCIIVEPAEVVDVYHQTDRVLASHARHGSYNSVNLREFTVGLYEF